MLSNSEHEALLMFDRLLMQARENETVADLLDQTLNVARMLDPTPDTKIMYGPFQRMHFEWQQMKYRMDSLEKKMDTYINQQNRYPSTYTGTSGTAFPQQISVGATVWPSNPSWDVSAASISMQNLKPLTTHDLEKFINENSVNLDTDIKQNNKTGKTK